MKATVISIIAAAVFIGGAFVLTRSGSDTGQVANANNVSIVDGKQIIEINVKGGYQPRKSVAKAGIPTIIRFNTKGTFDCSSSVRIPSMDISRSLPQTGSTDIDLGTPTAGQPIQGLCSMGMYNFSINFN